MSQQAVKCGLIGIFILIIQHADLAMVNPQREDVLQKVLQNVSPSAQEATEFIGLVGRKAYFRDANSTSLNFIDFVQFCHDNDMRTASILNQEEQNLILNFYRDTKYEKTFWLGGWDINSEGKFHWLDGTPFNYTAWDYTQPTNDRIENCVVFGTNGYKWFDVICEQEPSLSQPAPTSLCELQLTF